MTPLQVALVFGGNSKVVDRILEEKPDLDEPSDNGKTVLHFAAEFRRLPELAQLLRLGADPNAVDNEGRTPIHLAVSRDPDGQMTTLLLEAGADPNRAQRGDSQFRAKTLLHLAAETHNPVVVKHLLDGGADVNSRDGQGRTALHVAAERHHSKVVASLLDGGADVNIRDEQGRTALHLAMAMNQCKLSELLVEHGADLLTEDDAGRIPGQMDDGSNTEAAALIWWERIVQLYDQKAIAKLDAMLDAAPEAISFRTQYSPTTLLHRAVAESRLDVLDYLLARHVDPNAHGADGETPLHLACWPSPHSIDFATHLVDAGADVEAKDRAGQTPLHRAARDHNHDVLQMLIAKRADLHARDNAGTTVLDAAFERVLSPSRRQTDHRVASRGWAPTHGPIRRRDRGHCSTARADTRRFRVARSRVHPQRHSAAARSGAR